MTMQPSSRTARPRGREGTWAGMAVLVASLGCGPTIELEDDGTGSGGTEPATSSTSTSTSATMPPDTSSTLPPPGTTLPPPEETTVGPEDTGSNFLTPIDDNWPAIECDLFDQDCPPGEKCMPWANDGGNAWNATRCSPVFDNAAGEDEPCTVEGSGVSGIDSCDYGLMCWNVDPKTLEGTCVPLCTGDAGNPMCADGQVCVMANDGVLILCLPTCDPLVQDCADGLACLPWVDAFICVPPGMDTGGPGDSCEAIAACNPGLVCLAAEYVPDCMSAGCCSSLCDLDDPMPMCLPGQVCLPWYEPGMAPAGYENVGACGLP